MGSLNNRVVRGKNSYSNIAENYSDDNLAVRKNTHVPFKDKIEIDKVTNNTGNNKTSFNASILNTLLHDLANLQDNDNYVLDHNADDDEKLIESLKPHPLIGYIEPYYFCKEHPEFKNINNEEILLHLMNHKDHRKR